MSSAHTLLHILWMRIERTDEWTIFLGNFQTSHLAEQGPTCVWPFQFAITMLHGAYIRPLVIRSHLRLSEWGKVFFFFFEASTNPCHIPVLLHYTFISSNSSVQDIKDVTRSVRISLGIPAQGIMQHRASAPIFTESAPRYIVHGDKYEAILSVLTGLHTQLSVQGMCDSWFHVSLPL